MRRIATVAALVLLAGAPSFADDHNISRRPRKVSSGAKVTVTANNCAWGPNWTPVLTMTIERKSGRVLQEESFVADNSDGVYDGTTTERIRVPRNTKTGRYLVVVRCDHAFNDASGGGIVTSYEEDERIRVEHPAD